MDNCDQFRFVSLLALELDNGDITLPSLPDVVMKIRKMLERDDCDFERISQAVSIDPVLVSRLFVFANSAFYNRANVKIDTLEGAIGRLGFEVVRNAAMSLAMKQLYNSDKQDKAAKHLRAVWARGMKLSSMAFAIAQQQNHLNQETAFLCGLMHEVGKLYILTKAEEFPGFLGDPKSLHAVMHEWNPQISKSIVESWGFPEDVTASTDPATYVDHDINTPANLVDVICVAKLLVDGGEDNLTTIFEENLSCQKLGINEAAAAGIMAAYRDKLKTMQRSLTG
jgi:HD-like signal output (HDOD) protein